MEVNDCKSYLRQSVPAGAIIDKVGMLPVVVKNGVLQVRLAKPIAKKPELGDPGFQLPKGTRQFFDKASGQWRDIGRGYDPQSWDGVTLEAMPDAALRESIEEVGMVPENILRVWDLGPIAVKSASSGGEKLVHMFVAEVKDENHFTAPDAAHAAAGDVGWFSASSPQIRPDHAEFLSAMQDVLRVPLGLRQQSALQH